MALSTQTHNLSKHIRTHTHTRTRKRGRMCGKIDMANAPSHTHTHAHTPHTQVPKEIASMDVSLQQGVGVYVCTCVYV